MSAGVWSLLMNPKALALFHRTTVPCFLMLFFCAVGLFVENYAVVAEMGRVAQNAP
jgi:hypothetical protein